MENHMGWYATRSIYHFGVKENGVNTFEERIVSFKADDFDEANYKAAKESKEYANLNGFDVHDEQLTYEQDGEPLVDGYEIWSELYESTKSLDDFYKERYVSYQYNHDLD